MRVLQVTAGSRFPTSATLPATHPRLSSGQGVPPLPAAEAPPAGRRREAVSGKFGKGGLLRSDLQPVEGMQIHTKDPKILQRQALPPKILVWERRRRPQSTKPRTRKRSPTSAERSTKPTEKQPKPAKKIGKNVYHSNPYTQAETRINKGPVRISLYKSRNFLSHANKTNQGTVYNSAVAVNRLPDSRHSARRNHFALYPVTSLTATPFSAPRGLSRISCAAIDLPDVTPESRIP